MPEEIILGTVYNIFHPRYKTDSEFFKQVDRDIANIRKANFNLVMPFPLGQWNNKTKQRLWTRSDYLVKKIEENQLLMMPIMLKSNARSYLPLWKWLDIPDAIREYPEMNRSTNIYDIKYQHPRIQESIEDYFKAITERYKNSPSMYGYNIWNEPHYLSIDEITIPKFHKWLQKKYGTINELSRIWARDYSEWEQVDPVIKGNWTSSMPLIDWQLFRHANNGEIAKWSIETIRKYDNVHPVNTNTVGTAIMELSRDMWSVDDWEIAPHTDMFGISVYPDIWERRVGEKHPFWRLDCIYNTVRCAAEYANKPFIMSEMMTNVQTGVRLEKYLTYDDIHLWSWMAFANNCKGIVFWRWLPFLRGQQSFGRGLCQTNGDLAPRGLAAKEVGAVLKKHGKLLYQAQIIPAKAAILWDMVGFQKSTETTHKGQYFMTESYEGTYKALWEENIYVDIVRTDKPLTLKDLQQYKIIFLPFQMIISQNTAGLIKEYVNTGGWVVADARTGIIDDLDFGYPVNPGGGLDKLFGVQRLDWEGRDAEITVQISGGRFFEQDMTPDLTAIYYKEKLRILDGTQILAKFTEDGLPAMTVNKYGKGTAILAGFPLGGSYRLTQDDNIQQLIVTLAEMAGALPDAKVSTGNPENECMVKVQTLEKKRVVYVCNLSDKVIQGNVQVKNEGGIEFTNAKELISGEEINLRLDQQYFTFTIDILPKKAAVYLIQ